MIQIRNLLLLIGQGLTPEGPVVIRGRIQQIVRTKARLFIQLEDTTGTVQVTCDPGSAAAAVTGDRWQFEGTIDTVNFKGRNDAEPRPTVVATNAVALSLPRRTGDNIEDSNHRLLERGVVLAHLRSLASSAFRALDYTEVEPKFITLSAPASGLEPLRLSYVGFGAPAHLFASPGPQLRQLISGTDIGAAFCISRIFSTTFRDESTSNEALTLMAMRALPDASTIRVRPFHLERAISAMAADDMLAGLFGDWFDDDSVRFPNKAVGGVPKPLVTPVEFATLESYDKPSQYMSEPTNVPPESFQRLVAPERTILAERAIVGWYGSAKLEVTTLHLERLSGLLTGAHARPLVVLKNLIPTRRTSQ